MPEPGGAVKITEPRMAVDFAKVLRWLAEEVQHDAKPIEPVMDNLNTHKLAGL